LYTITESALTGFTDRNPSSNVKISAQPKILDTVFIRFPPDKKILFIQYLFYSINYMQFSVALYNTIFVPGLLYTFIRVQTARFYIHLSLLFPFTHPDEVKRTQKRYPCQFFSWIFTGFLYGSKSPYG